MLDINLLLQIYLEQVEERGEICAFCAKRLKCRDYYHTDPRTCGDFMSLLETKEGGNKNGI